MSYFIQLFVCFLFIFCLLFLRVQQGIESQSFDFPTLPLASPRQRTIAMDATVLASHSSTEHAFDCTLHSVASSGGKINLLSAKDLSMLFFVEVLF